MHQENILVTPLQEAFELQSMEKDMIQGDFLTHQEVFANVVYANLPQKLPKVSAKNRQEYAVAY